MTDDNVVYDGSKEESAIDFDEEASNLQDDEFWTPPTGTTKVTFMDNGRKTSVHYDEDDEPTPKAIFKIRVEDEEGEKLWSITRGKSASSLYGQLVRVGKDRGGLVGEELTLIRNGEGKQTQYTVQEAADL